ncbi:efflux RND transporter periplasmic adaptor subunit [Plastoroseomonas arctica]|uniref:Efflux RND transporter periplasmic adaptor subunit n=1 Tax=Plastoroseomonas arctica TaxID=1509237 RepID=A0AAF1KHP6_9PROT|nr:efflux RND transporter periplasmic adaptor subunit [Plastoroseomonas arctica]MBR0653670.1 efflux RND transporter periplasmic adaptor subunit [Plastoroseomonas arctica]
MASPPAAPRSLTRYWRWGLALIPVLALGAWFGPALLLGPRVSVTLVSRGTLLRSVVATGVVTTPYRVAIASQITGTVAEIPVLEGQAVTLGQVLVRLEDGELQAGLAQARSAVAQAETQLHHLTEVTLPVAIRTLAQSEATLLNAGRQFARSEALQTSGFATRAALDEARVARDVAEAQMQAARIQRDSNTQGGTDEVLAQAVLTEARASLRAAQSRLDHATIAAPVAGTLIARSIERGDVVQANTPLMTLSPRAAPQLVVQIDERNLGLIALGQPALASADAYPQARFSARVAYINPSVDPQRAAVEVKLDVREPPPALREDMTVSVDITVAERTGILILPLTAIRDAAGAAWILRAEAGHARRVPVRLGLRGAVAAEILEGLSEGDRVLPASAAVAAGDRVRAP